MSKRDDLIAKYAADMKDKLGTAPDMDLLTKVVVGCGPSIYNSDAETVAASDPAELERIKQNYLIKKLGLGDSPELMDAINAVVAKYGSANRNKYRAVVYYMLCQHFSRQSAYA
ncbi:DUF2853 family protein [Paracoccus sp. CPCC 101403]|uniref:DUF2853 family protein n=2 Tax=Paracoccus broussonetiae TaxID=3075834 RepID=A0ABU3EFV4_9RHOB|nr:DUF2853 family protein [Paracoccus sp. CPCC 101403]MDT1063114.1 DUF2853 family protein [Paracoccus sp. CPCC 101403]